MKDIFSFSNPKLSSQYEFIKIIKHSNDYKEVKEIAKLRRGNVKENTSNKVK
ncbi:hypothetical protein OSSY52_09370 [Tepiditoga spiralis]|uniref:Uncharacterized protein n=1 Tax=Tepiditoga spiralis TaxID=2108365 RepID=A0A7G1G627_9BACT|nr:hypothetical protein [Tepiditoga spiralis]BBE30796.1 hypothetical protein OSSY52_09370 [Tepiditoga spiralis]